MGRFRFAVAAAAALATGFSPWAWAQIEEVIVTAQKRAESAQDVGLTIEALDEDSYRELTRGTLDGLAAQLTNVQAYANNSFLQSVHVRGIGLNEFQGQYDAPVAQHFDEVYISKPWMVARPTYDIQRVEVLKGPQGTLFGRNTTGGSVNFYTNAPSQDYAASIELSVDEHERYSAQGMVNGGLAQNLSGRFSFFTSFGSGGPQKNLFTGDEHGKPNIIDLRGQLLWEGENTVVRALVHGGIDKSQKVAWKGPGLFNFGAPGLCPQALTGAVTQNPSACAKFGGFAALGGNPAAEFEPEDKFTINQNTPPDVDDTFYGGYLRVERELGFATLTSVTAYEYYERDQQEDSQSDIFNSTSTHYYNEMNQISQEFRLTGEFNPRWRYVLGLFYEHDDLDQVDGSDLSEQPLPGVTPPFADQFFAQFELELNSLALFMHNEFDFTDNITVNLGMRYTRDEIEVSNVLLGLGNLPRVGDEDFVTPCLITTIFGGPQGSPACPFLGPIAPFFNDDRVDTNFSWRFGLEYTPNENWLLYGNLTTGYRSGGYSLPFAGAATQFEPETMFAQEMGFKGLLMNGTLQVNAAFFRYIFDDVQVNVDDPVSPLVPITRNIGEQQNVGIETQITWQPNDRWTVRQGVGWLNAEYNETTRVITTYAGPVPLQGQTPVNSPKWTYNGLVRYEQPIFGNWRGSANINYRHIDERNLEATGQPFDRADAYWVVNMRAAIASADGQWELAVFGNNLFDEEYLTYINNIGFFKLDIFGETRTFGASLRYQYD